MIDEQLKQQILRFQRNEITEFHIYSNLANADRIEHDKKTLLEIAAAELKHYKIWQEYTGQEVLPDKLKILWYLIIARIFGVTFAIKLMESGENKAQKNYAGVVDKIPAIVAIKKEEEEHENQLINMIDEERLRYIGSIVLGLNDALVELTGVLAGLTFALQNTRLIGLTGLITGIAASLSMASSEYLATKTEAGEKCPNRAAFYTGLTYVGAVIVLIAPFFVIANYFLALVWAIFGAISLIFLFTFYYSVVKEVSFRKRFTEMTVISLGVATLSFLIGLLVRQFLGVEF